MASDPSAEISRRLALKLAAGTAAMPVLGSAATGPGIAAADLAGPRGLLQAYRRMRYSAGPEVTFSWMRATKYGLADHRPTPLFGMEIGTLARTRTTGPDSFDATALEIVFFTDLATGERIEEIINPFTGERLARPDSLVGPTTITYTIDGARYPAGLPGAKFDIKPSIVLFAAEGDDVWVQDDTSTTVTAADTGRLQFVLTDWSSFHCTRASLADASLASVPTQVSFNSVSSWPGWMKMGDRPGEMVSRGTGRKFARLEDMPERFRKLLGARYPELARDPAAALDRPPFNFAP